MTLFILFRCLGSHMFLQMILRCRVHISVHFALKKETEYKTNISPKRKLSMIGMRFILKSTIYAQEKNKLQPMNNYS